MIEQLVQRPPMCCSKCGQRKAYPDGFSNSIYSICWSCAWKDHMADHHKLSWRQRRRNRKDAITRAADKLLRENEKERSRITIEPLTLLTEEQLADALRKRLSAENW